MWGHARVSFASLWFHLREWTGSCFPSALWYKATKQLSLIHLLVGVSVHPSIRPSAIQLVSRSVGRSVIQTDSQSFSQSFSLLVGQSMQ